MNQNKSAVKVTCLYKDPDSEIEIVNPNKPSQQQLKSAQTRFSSPKLPLSRSPSRPRLSQNSARLAQEAIVVLSSDSEEAAIDDKVDNDDDDDDESLPDLPDILRTKDWPSRTNSAPTSLAHARPLISKTARTQSDVAPTRLDKGKGRQEVRTESPASSFEEARDDRDMISEPPVVRSSPEVDHNFGRSPSSSRGPTPCSSRQSQTKKRVAETEENEEAMSTTKKKKPKASSSKLTQAEKDANKAANQLEKEKAKMAKKAAQEKEKADKREMKGANKLSNHRKDTVAEVTMHVPSAVTNLKTHPLTKAVEALRLRMNVEGGKMNQPVESEVEEEAVRWVRRRVKEWNEDKDEYVPCAPKLVTEPTVLVVWTANQLDGWVADGPRELLYRAEALRRLWPTEQIFILVHGLGTLMRTAKTKSDAIVSNNIRAGLAASRGEPEAYTQRLKENGLPKNTEDKILREIERMKIATKCFVLRVEDKNDLANWMWEMTLEIGVRPYKSKKQDLKADLNLEVGGSKGKDAEDTYIKMLSSLVRVTENEAKGIVKSYPTLNKLYSAWDRLVNGGERVSAEQMLARCAKGKNVNGVASDRMLGKVTSKRIFDIMYQTKDGNVCANNM